MRQNNSQERAKRDEILADQARKLGKMLEFACDQVPVYQGLCSVVKRLPPLEALKAFPLLTKDQLQEKISDYLPRNFKSIPHYECSTGGTSGNQLKFYVDDCSQAMEIGFMHRQWARVGYTPRCSKATFRGVNFPRAVNLCYWQHNPIYNEMQFSPFHVNSRTLPSYIDQLRSYRPQYLHGYPSAIALLADYLLQNERAGEITGIRAALVGSEALLPGQRESIERAFSTRVYSWYGHSERVILGGECEVSSAYHHFPDYGVLEILDEEGRQVQIGERGELVGTGLLNKSLPLIRYRTGDSARLLEPHCECGRHFDRFDQVEGRWEQEYIVGRDGSSISLAALNMHGPMFDHVDRYQYYQNTPGRMELRLEVSPRFTSHDADNLIRAFDHKTGSELKVVINVVSQIPLTNRGKLKRLIQEIPKTAASDQPRFNMIGQIKLID